MLATIDTFVIFILHIIIKKYTQLSKKKKIHTIILRLKQIGIIINQIKTKQNKVYYNFLNDQLINNHFISCRSV
jgi:hypothetical protein